MPAEAKTAKKIEKKTEEIAEELKIGLPKGRASLILKLISLLTLVGGLSIIGNAFADTVSPGIDVGFYFLRVITGVIAIGVSYGIAAHKVWAPWLYAVIVITGIIVNLFIAVIPALILAYLFTQWKYFHKESFQESKKKFLNKIKRLI